MTEKHNVLIFPAETGIGLEIFDSLRYKRNLRLLGATSVTHTSYADFLYQKVHRLPFVTEKGFLDDLNTLIEHEEIEYVFPCHDDVCLALSNMRNSINAKVIGQSYEINSIVRYKSRTYEALEGHIQVPEIRCLHDGDCRFPVFCKPDKGSGSRGTYLIEQRSEIDNILSNIDPNKYVFIENLPGDEFTIDCFSNVVGLMFCGGRTRSKTMGGMSTISKTENRPIFREMAEAIQRVLPMRGAWFFQVKEDQNGAVKLMEVAPRIAGTMCLYRMLGVNFSELSILEADCVPLEVQAHNIYAEVSRTLPFGQVYSFSERFGDLYVDLDDTLILDESRVNTELVGLIHHWRNTNRKTHLVTRHVHNPIETLSSFRLDNLFDEVYHLRDEPKSQFVPAGSVLLDDSYRERSDCSQNGAYGFAPDAIPFLMCSD